MFGDNDPFKDFDRKFDKAQSNMTKFAVVGGLASLVMTGAIIAGIAYAVVWVAHHI